MKKAVPTLIIILILVSTIVIVAQPEMPTSECTPINNDLSKLCLSFIPKYYDAGHLTYLGHTKAWIYRSLDKFGIKLGKQISKSLMHYSSFEDAVNCYLTTSSDVSLNMTLTPTEFEARFEPIAREYGIQKTLEGQ